MELAIALTSGLLPCGTTAATLARLMPLELRLVAQAPIAESVERGDQGTTIFGKAVLGGDNSPVEELPSKNNSISLEGL